MPKGLDIEASMPKKPEVKKRATPKRPERPVNDPEERAQEVEQEKQRLEA